MIQLYDILRKIVGGISLILICSSCGELRKQNSQLPNILFILADDLGYGDVGSYNPNSTIPTPNLDRLSKEGIRFTEAHSPATVCTPTRYGILTGRMPFRTGKYGVFNGAGGPCLIENKRITIGNMLQEKGYTTALFGKWHLGLTFFDNKGDPIHSNSFDAVKTIDYSQSIPDGPINRGFDQFFGTACCPTTDALYAFIDGNHIPVPPTNLLDKTNLPKHHYSKDNDIGMIAPGYDLQEIDMIFLERSIDFLKEHAEERKGSPFFLFHSMQAVHLPSFAGANFRGKTTSGPHGDFIFQMDHIVGALIAALDKYGFSDNTLVIFTSDNGPEVPTILAMRRDFKHDGAAPWRGVKRDNWEGGHRVPFIAYWPNKIKGGKVSDALISQTDLMATFADLVDYNLSNNVAEDSYSFLPEILSVGKSSKGREYMLQQAAFGNLSIRQKAWKYLDHKGSGGNSYSEGGYWGMLPFALLDSLPDAPAQLYNLDVDPGETRNLYFQNPEIVKELKNKLEEYKITGRSVALRK